MLVDAILHIVSGTINFIVLVLLFTLEIGHDKARVLSLLGDLQFGDHLAPSAPAAGGIVKRIELPLFLSAQLS